MPLLLRESPVLRVLPVILCLTSVSSFAADQLTRRSDGTIIRGRLEALSRTQLEIRRSNDELVTVPPDDLRDIRFDREPPALQTARSNERSGEYAAAIEQLQDVQTNYDGDDERVPTEISFLIARCRTQQALIDAEQAPLALQSLESFLKEHPRSYRSLEAMLLQSRLLAATDSSAATRLLEQLRNCGVEGFEVQAGIVLGRLLLDGGKAEDALRIFDDLIQKNAGKPEAIATLSASRIGRAACLQKLSQPDEALSTLNAVVAELPEEEYETLARAWNQIGDCQRDLGIPQAALLAYLHVDILYPEATEAHAEALYRLGPLWEANGHPDRAQDARTRLRERYPRSRWTEQSETPR